MRDDSGEESFLSFKNSKFSHSERSDKMTQSLNLWSLHQVAFKGWLAFQWCYKWSPWYEASGNKRYAVCYRTAFTTAHIFSIEALWLKCLGNHFEFCSSCKRSCVDTLVNSELVTASTWSPTCSSAKIYVNKVLRKSLYCEIITYQNYHQLPPLSHSFLQSKLIVTVGS